MRALRRLGPRPDPLELHELPGVAGLVLGPDRLHRFDALAQEAHPGPGVSPVVAHLLAVPARADPELEPPAGQMVDRRDLLGSDDRIALDHQADAAADPQRRGRLRRGGQRDEQVVGVAVLARQLAAARVRALAAGGDVGVLGEEQRLVAVLLDQAGDRPGGDRVGRGEVSDSEFHPSSLPAGRDRDLLAPDRNPLTVAHPVHSFDARMPAHSKGGRRRHADR